MNDNKDVPRQIAFTPELARRPRLRELLLKTLEMAEGTAFDSAREALMQTLEQRSEIINEYGQHEYDVTLKGLSREVALPDWLLEVPEKKDTPSQSSGTGNPAAEEEEKSE